MDNTLQKYTGSCHCGDVRFNFTAPVIDSGLRCNCSICQRKGATMTAFVVAPEEIQIEIKDEALATYTFDNHVAKHHFCKRCGIYPFHQTVRKPGHYRINIGCVEGVDATELPFEVFDGASI